MKVSEAIDRLQVGDTVWVKGKVEDNCEEESLPLVCDISEKGVWLYEDDEIFLTEPVSKEVKIPECVGKWINYCDAQEFSLHTAMNRHCDVLPGFIADVYQDFRAWLTDDNYQEHEEIFARAWLDGFTVEPKRWVVKIGDYHSTYIESLTIIPKLSYTLSEQESAYKFTNHERAEVVATLVEGQVEEVAE